MCAYLFIYFIFTFIFIYLKNNYMLLFLEITGRGGVGAIVSQKKTIFRGKKMAALWVSSSIVTHVLQSDPYLPPPRPPRSPLDESWGACRVSM